MEKIKLSIITVCYNAIKEIEKTIESVLSQTYPYIEYIIIDGGSTDGTLNIIRRYENRITKYISEKDRGVYDAMNKGLTMATGEWVNFLNAGDVFVNDKILENISPFLTDNNDVVFGDVQVIAYNHMYISKADAAALSNINSTSMGFNHQACFVKTESAKQHPFNLQYKLAADYGMMMDLYRAKANFCYCGFPIAVFDTTGISSTHIYQHRYECLSINFPEKNVRNRIKATYIAFIASIKKSITLILNRVNPNIMSEYYAKKNNFILVDK